MPHPQGLQFYVVKCEAKPVVDRLAKSRAAVELARNLGISPSVKIGGDTGLFGRPSRGRLPRRPAPPALFSVLMGRPRTPAAAVMARAGARAAASNYTRPRGRVISATPAAAAPGDATFALRTRLVSGN
ncbi:hypothetical protein EVAR_97285_1 [Eumeta japonica]|uniref:Uncharacterized protein n=1 Tax=Eumeta variegata TaxID=151549 RepID=A0A4C1XF88_EUMVA|nr:hypothetical protein EVAR_97285_1 [Eumeta japonica]